jgi:hypothetical protein
MGTETTTFTDIAAKIKNFGGAYPRTGVALLPVNFANAASLEELLQASDTATLRKLLKEANVPVDDLFEPDRRPMYIKNKSADWVAPIIFFSAAFYSQNSLAVSLALNVIGNYATDFLRGIGHAGDQAKLDIVVETKTKDASIFKKASYIGPAEGIRELDGVVRRMLDD